MNNLLIGQTVDINVRQNQQLLLSVAMQQAFQVLQMPLLELEEWLKNAIEQNPVLEYSEEIEKVNRENVFSEENEIDFEKSGFEVLAGLDEGFENSIFEEEKRFKEETFTPSTLTLFEHLMLQAKMNFPAAEIPLAEKIIGSLDERGFLCVPLMSLFEENELVLSRSILEKIQTFDPPGIGASDLKSSLLLQLKLKEKEKSLAYRVIDQHFEDLVHNRLPILQKSLNCTQEALQRAIFREIANLTLHPASRFNFDPVQPVLPDLFIEKENESWQVIVNEENLPSFRIGELFLNSVEETESPEKNFFRRQIAAAKWLERIIERRKKILTEIGKFLIKRQPGFLSGETKLLTPMTLQELAATLQLHHSTVVRAVSHKYLYCRQGLFPLRSFFTTGKVDTREGDASSQQVKVLLREFVSEEDKRVPLSDHALSRKMQRKGITVARRTVTKYRKALKIAPASIRRQHLAAKSQKAECRSQK